MPHEDKLPSRKRPQPGQALAANEPARFLRNLTSLPDADFASTYSPAIAAVFARYTDLPDPDAARRALLRALKAALKRRRAFILPRFTQAEDSWRIRECASYAVAVAVLVEHACALLDHTDRSADPDAWARILGDAGADPDGSTSPAALFHAIVPAQGRRWIAREPLVQTLIASYFTGAAPDELRDIVGPVIAGFGQDRQALGLPPDHDPPPPEEPVPSQSSTPSPRPLSLGDPDPSRTGETRVTGTAPTDSRRQGGDVGTLEPASTDSGPEPPRLPEPRPPTGTPASLPPTASGTDTPSAPASGPPPRRRRGPPVADILDGLAAAPAPRTAATPGFPGPARPRRPDIGDHGATTARVGHAADYARRLAVENGSRPMGQTTSFLLPGPVPDAIGQPLSIEALFPAPADAAHIDSDTIAAWIDFHDHLVDALQSGAQSANAERSLVHLLDVGAFLAWPQVALPFADERGVDPAAIKSAMRAAHVLAVNRADAQDDPHAFPALTGNPGVTCHGLVTLPEYLWPDASLRPTEPSTFVRPPAIYGQRYRRPR